MDFAQNSGEHEPLNTGAAEPIQPATETVVPQPPAPPQEVVPRFVVWLHRVSLVVFVVFCIELGMLLTILPWFPVWNQNSFLFAHPALRAFAQQNFIRGLVTGIGLVDIWIGIWEAVHYRDPGKA